VTINHENTPGVLVCPYCDYEIDDTDFRTDGFDEGEEQCPGCDEWFSFESVDRTVYWTTKKIPVGELEQGEGREGEI